MSRFKGAVQVNTAAVSPVPIPNSSGPPECITGENGQLFGSVTSKDIADGLEAQGYTIERRKIVLDEPIKSLGEFKVPLRLHREVTVEIAVNVVKEEE